MDLRRRGGRRQSRLVGREASRRGSRRRGQLHIVDSDVVQLVPFCPANPILVGSSLSLSVDYLSIVLRIEQGWSGKGMDWVDEL